MHRKWTDPRDGTEWVITLTPFGSQGGWTGGSRGPQTVAFHRPGMRPAWTPYRLDKPLAGTHDGELVELLDRALERRAAALGGERGRTG